MGPSVSGVGARKGVKGAGFLQVQKVRQGLSDELKRAGEDTGWETCVMVLWSSTSTAGGETSMPAEILRVVWSSQREKYKIQDERHSCSVMSASSVGWTVPWSGELTKAGPFYARLRRSG